MIEKEPSRARQMIVFFDGNVSRDRTREVGADDGECDDKCPRGNDCQARNRHVK